MEDNFFVRAWNRLIYWLNVLLGEEPSDMLLQQQVNSYQRGLDRSYAQLTRSGGRLRETVGVLASNKSKLRATQIELQRMLKDKEKMTDGPEKELKEQQIALKVKMVNGLQKLVATMESGINQSRASQNMGELNFQSLNMQRDLANTEAGMEIDREAFAKMRKEIADAQLAAAGIINGASAIKDNRGKLRRRADRAEGEADAASRMASTATGWKGNTTTLNEEEDAVLQDAMERAGVAKPKE